MKVFILFISLAFTVFLHSEEVIFNSPFVADEGKSKIGEKWEIGHGEWSVKNGVITGKENKEDEHAAGVKAKVNFPENFKFNFEFCFNGAKKINVRFIQDGKKIFIINIQKKQYRFQIEKGEEGKSGNFLTAASKEFSFNKGQWYKGRLEIKGENFSVKIADNKLLKGSNKLITRKKNLFIFNVGGDSASIRNIKITNF